MVTGLADFMNANTKNSQIEYSKKLVPKVVKIGKN